ncbi:MAG: hypothetical protein IKS55_11575 [Oscillospiraceae bacterium]|nr:hypothetical protein [Oscillospiraceae bacterium]
MIRCKLCDTLLETKHLRRDGSILCPVCGQIYWREAVQKAMDATKLPETEQRAEMRHTTVTGRAGRHTVSLRTVPITAR